MSNLNVEPVTFQEALERGISPDGSLYVPESIPQLSAEDLERITHADRQELANIMLTPWLGDELPQDDLKNIINAAATFDTPVVKVGNKHVLELFHGPTLAFKDVAARYLAAFINYFNQKSGRISTVIVATSGDTGGAMAHGFANLSNVNLVILYPKDRISLLQREQLRRVAKNVYSLEVEGDFNDCQNLAKKALADQSLSKKFNLNSANSINIGRLLPQTIYYASMYGQLGGANIRTIVPTGNLGNLTAGVIARSMGIPIAKFVAANNMNDSLSRYLATGEYQPVSTVQTLSNAMDVSAPNNLPRFMNLFNDDIKQARSVVEAVSVTDQETIDTIKRVYKETNYLLDPHTAVGWRASEVLENDNGNDVIVATASPLKFAEEIFQKTGIQADNSALLKKLRRQPERYWNIDNSLDELTNFLEIKIQ